MTFRPRAKTIAAAVGLALGPLAATGAQADSAVGVDTSINSSLNTGVARDPVSVDPEFEPRRSPIGLLYPRAPVAAEKPTKTDGGWEYRGSVELGGLVDGGDASNVFFTRYRNVDSGFHLRYFGIEAERRDSASFVEAVGGAVARDDQFYSLTFGRYNDWKFKAYYNETPTVFTTNYRSLWSGVGTDTLTLNGLTPGGSATAAQSQTNIRNALAATPASELGITRKKGGLRFDMGLGDEWKLYAAYTNERREGSRPYGMVFGGGGGGGNIEIPESIDNTTHEIFAGLRYADPVQSFNVELSASLYRNGMSTYTVENPLTISTNTLTPSSPNLFTFARFDADPDNDYYRVKAEYARALPDLLNGRLTATFTAARMKNNDALIAPTTLPLTGLSATLTPTGSGSVSAANVWNTTAALSKQSADAEIDTALANVALTLNPLASLSLKGYYRYYSVDNSTEYTTCNPLTGQWGRLLNDGSGGSFVSNAAFLAAKCDLAAVQALNLVPSAGNVNIKSVPFGYTRSNYGLQADWRISPRSNGTLLLEREDYKPDHRERESTWEDRIKVGYTNRALGDVTLLASYEYDRKRGSTYIVDPYEHFLSASMGPLPTANTSVTSWFHNVDTLQKFDLADRDQNIVNARLNWAAAPALDLGVTFQYKDASYPSSTYGRTGTADQTSVNLDVNYQPAAEWGVYGFYTWQNAKMGQLGLQPNACTIGTTYYFYSSGAINTTGTPPAGTTLVATTAVSAANWQSVCGTASATSPLYPTSRSWSNEQKSTNQTVGIGGRYDFPKARVDASYLYVNGRTSTSYTYNAAALGLTAPTANVAVIGSGMPDLTFVQHIVRTSLFVPVMKNVAARLYAEYEDGRVSDWHYDGVAQNPVPATNAAYLDYGPQNYHAYLVGIYVQVGF